MKTDTLSSPAGCMRPHDPTGSARRNSWECQNGARAQGFAAPRQNRARPSSLCAVPANGICDGRLRRDHEAEEVDSWPRGQANINQAEDRLHKILDTTDLPSS